MKKWFLALVFSLCTSAALAVCPGTITDCPSPTYNAIHGHSLTSDLVPSLGGVTPTFSATGTYYPGHSLIGIQTFCASGCTHTSGTYTPTSGTNQVILEVQGSGGASGSCPSTGGGNACISGSAASGSYAKVLYTTGFSGITMTPGAAGVAGSAGANPGGAGATTTAGALISCPGGAGGPAGSAGTPAAMVFFGSPAADTAACTITGGTTILSVAGHGPGVGFVLSSASSGQMSAAGANSVMGLGGTPAFASATSGGNPGTGYGSGPSGAIMDASQSQRAGIAGQPSVIVVYEFN